MVVSKEILTDYKEIYEKAIKLVNEESKNDPPTDPFRSHYAARDLLLDMKENLKKAALAEAEAKESDNEFIYNVILSSVYRDLGRIYVFTEEPSTGERYLKDCLELVTDNHMKPEAIIPHVGALNELGIVYAGRQDYKESFDMLVKAEAAYHEFKESALEPLTISDVFGTREEVEQGKGASELESLYTLCCFYLAQVFGHLGELEKSGKYCHMTLRRQVSAKSYEPIDFALNAATLSQYYIGQNMYKEARHHLSAASFVMDEHEATMLKPEMSEQQRADATETFQHRNADVARCWAKYGLALLTASKERLYNDDEDKLAADTKRLAVQSASYSFPELQLSSYEQRIDTNYCLTFDDAKLVYHFVIESLDKAKDYYKPETEATEYAKIIKDYAELYQSIAFFEEDPVNQAKMQKRRAKYYEDLLELLNPVFYLAICRECWYGAGLAQCAILDIKLDALKANRSPAPQEIQKINAICRRAIVHFMDFVKSYMEKDGVTMRSNLTCEEQQNVLYAYFHLGRLQYKMISPDQTQMLANLELSLRFYKMFTDECALREEPAKALQAEIGVCREMVNLLPLKIANLKKRLGK